MTRAPRLLQITPDRALWSVAWPVILMGWLRTGYLLTDAWFVGRLGDDALAALGAASFGWWIVAILAELPSVGVHALVARQVGAEEPDRVGPTLVQGAWVGLGIALSMLVLIGAVPAYLAAVGLTHGSSTFALGREFLVASLLGGGALVLHGVVGGVFRGLGATREALGITVLGFLLNAVLDPVLITWMGIAGAAWATTASSGLGAIVGLLWLARTGHPLVAAGPVAAELRRIVQIGLPVTARGVAFSMVYVVMGRLIVQFGEIQLAGLAVGHRIENLAYHVCVAYEVAAATLVGQNLGAGRISDARRAADRAALACGGLMVPAMLLLFVFAPALFDLFADSPEAIAAGTLYVRIQAIAFVLMAWESVYGGAFAGAGNTVPPFWIVSIGTVARLPLAWFLAWPMGLGVAGIWWAIALSTIAKGVVSALWFRRSGVFEPQTVRS